MRSQAMAVLWGIWARNRGAVLAAAGCTLGAMLLNLLVPGTTRIDQRHNPLVEMFIFNLAGASLLLTLSIFSYTEVDTPKSQTGFPRRLFVLPMTAFQMVFVPMLLGAIAIEVLALTWAVCNTALMTPWFLVALPAYMIFHQSVQWTLSRLGSLRMLLMGIIGIVLIMAPIFRSPSARLSLSESSGVSMNSLTLVVAALAVMAFFIAWIHVSRQRFGGGSAIGLQTSLITRVFETRARNEKSFSSAAAAQFWFEWRRSGLVLPLLTSGLLIAVIAPASWYIRNEPGSTFRILTIVLAMPALLAWPIGKGFSKPDFWSQDLSMSDFSAVKPITDADMVLIKMKMAAVSAIFSWLSVVAFLIVWLPLWGNLAPVKNAANPSWLVPVAIALLAIVAGILVTWRFMVSGLWLGLSGNKNLFMAFAVPYAFFPLVAIGLTVTLNESDRLLPLLTSDLSRFEILEVIAALAVIAKFSAWVLFWRDVASDRVTNYLLFWAASTLPLLVLAIFLWEIAKPHLPAESDAVRNLLILASLSIVPLARVGYAPSTLAKNRHRA